MKTKRIFSVFLLLFISAILVMVVSSRNDMETEVIIDGGTNLPVQDGGDAEDAVNILPTVNLPEINIESWELTLVNADNPVKDVPIIAQIGTTGTYFDKRAVDAVLELRSAAREAGYRPYINLAYLPSDSQQYYFDLKAQEIANSEYPGEDAKNKAALVVERPGQSEHQLGLALDITDDFVIPYTNETISENLLSWLTEHACEYGFIQRYPAGKENITGYVQPYHFRYVGVEAAEYITKHGLCLEEFLALYK